MLLLTSITMAQFARQWSFSAQLKFDFPTVALAFVLGLEALGLVVDLVRCPVLPLLVFVYVFGVLVGVSLLLRHRC